MNWYYVFLLVVSVLGTYLFAVMLFTLFALDEKAPFKPTFLKGAKSGVLFLGVVFSGIGTVGGILLIVNSVRCLLGMGK